MPSTIRIAMMNKNGVNMATAPENKTQNLIPNASIRFRLSAVLKCVYSLVVLGFTCPTHSAICAQSNPFATQIEMNECLRQGRSLVASAYAALPEVPLGEGPAGAGLEIPFESIGLVVVGETDGDHKFPGRELGRIG